MKNPQDYQNPSATSSLIIERAGKILLVRRKHEPYQGMLALPGGFLNYGQESLEQTGCRELEEETGLIAEPKDLALIVVQSDPGRDPRGHVIDHVYWVARYTGKEKAGNDASSLIWKPLDNMPAKLAFDHGSSIYYFRRIKESGMLEKNVQF